MTLIGLIRVTCAFLSHSLTRKRERFDWLALGPAPAVEYTCGISPHLPYNRRGVTGTTLVVQWLRFCASSAEQKGFPGGSVVKNWPATLADSGLIPQSGRSPGEGNDNPLWYSCLGNPMDRGTWQATAHGVTEWDISQQQQIAGKGAYVCVLSHFSCGTWYLINGKANISSSPILPKYFYVCFMFFSISKNHQEQEL